MSLESATYISQLVSSNPLSTDKKKQGDDHLRLIKSVLQATFPNADHAVYFPDTSVKNANYGIIASDGGKTFLCDTTSPFTLTLPSLGSTDDTWYVEVIKTTLDANPVFIVPSVGTINGYSQVRRSIEHIVTRVFWTGTTFVATRANGVPIGSLVEFYGANLPHGHLWPDGTTFIAADYVELNTALGGSTKPDRRGRSAFGKDNMGGSTAGRITSALNFDGTVLGGSGGSQSHTLSVPEMPAHTHIQDAHHHSVNQAANAGKNDGTGGNAVFSTNPATVTGDTTPTNQNTGGGSAHSILPPAIVANFGLVAE